MKPPELALDPSQTVADRLRQAHAAYRDAQEVTDRTSKLRRQLVLEAADAGMSYRAIGEIIDVSISRVSDMVGQAARGA